MNEGLRAFDSSTAPDFLAGRSVQVLPRDGPRYSLNRNHTGDQPWFWHHGTLAKHLAGERSLALHYLKK